ncbi:hypothetical protein J2Z26_002035 [Bacillus luteolus]|nr:hypothetical protein [Cytobacillus luteolus]
MSYLGKLNKVPMISMFRHTDSFDIINSISLVEVFNK